MIGVHTREINPLTEEPILMDKFPVNLLVYYLTQTTKLQGDIDSWHNKGIIFHPITITIFKIQHLSDSLFWQVEKKWFLKRYRIKEKTHELSYFFLHDFIKETLKMCVINFYPRYEKYQKSFQVFSNQRKTSKLEMNTFNWDDQFNERYHRQIKDAWTLLNFSV